METLEHPSAADLRSSQNGFDNLFSNELDEAKLLFGANDSPFHLLGLGACTFLQAALGMEVP